MVAACLPQIPAIAISGALPACDLSWVRIIVKRNCAGSVRAAFAWAYRRNP
jgi:hypothetical protein